MAAPLHGIIADHSLDIVPLNETRILEDDPPAITDDIDVPRFAVSHQLRPSPKGPSLYGGGVVIVSVSTTATSHQQTEFV